MGKVSIACLVVSTVVLLITFGQGMGLLRGGDVESHLYWAMGTLICALTANLVAIVHAAQSDRIIRKLREDAESTGAGRRVDGLESGPRL
jgi:hypothetical protein